MKHNAHQLAHQRGIVLIVAMIMLVIMSILGISSVRNIALEERMSAASHDRNIALQAAEAALLAGEQDARKKTNLTVDPDVEFGAGACAPVIVNGYVATPIRACASDWMTDSSLMNWATQSRKLDKSSVNLGTLAGDNTRYLIEFRGTQVCKAKAGESAPTDCEKNNSDPFCNCNLFRITAMSNPGNSNDRASVMLQTLLTTY